MGFVLETYFENKYDTKLYYNPKLPYAPMARIGAKIIRISKYVCMYYKNNKHNKKRRIKKYLLWYFIICPLKIKKNIEKRKK